MTKRKLKYKITAKFDDGTYDIHKGKWRLLERTIPKRYDWRQESQIVISTDDKIGDGVMLISHAHPSPKRPWWKRLFMRRDIRKSALETVEIEIPGEVETTPGEAVEWTHLYGTCMTMTRDGKLYRVLRPYGDVKGRTPI